MKKILSLSLALLLLTLSITFLFSCADTEESVNNDVENIPEQEEVKNEILGKETNIKFDFSVTHADGNVVLFKVETTCDNLGDALLEGDIVKGDIGEFGLYVTEIDGEEASWDKDNAYWYFYKNGEALMEGISSTPIANGDSFEAKYTK